jgi:glycosyltransferase involved in cell wall biosynthesis
MAETINNGRDPRGKIEMTFLEEITPLILTYNEAPNIERVLACLTWAKRVVIVDSDSTDQTETLAKQFSNVIFLRRPFDTHSQQWNFGLGQVATDWVLALDADYVLPEEFILELRQLQPGTGVAAYFARFKYCIDGHPLRATLYPARAVLFSRGHCHYEQDGHTQRLHIAGPSETLAAVIHHDDRKPLDHWLRAQSRYAALETAKLLDCPREALGLADRIRASIVLAPILVFFHVLIGKGLILDGWRGWYYVLQRTLAEVLLSLHLLERKLRRAR